MTTTSSPLIDFGVFLWVVLTVLPIVAAGDVYYAYKSHRPYLRQPRLGTHYNAGTNLIYIRSLLVCIQVCLTGMLVLALALDQFGFLGDDFMGVALGLTTQGETPSGGRHPLTCGLTYVDQGHVFPREYLDGTRCFSIVASSVVAFVYALVSGFVALYQIAVLQPFFKWHCFVQVQPGQDLASATGRGVWARYHLILVLHLAMTIMYGVICLVIDGVRPGASFWIMLGVTTATLAQGSLLKRYIRALPPQLPHLQLGGNSAASHEYSAVIAEAEAAAAAAKASAIAASNAADKLAACVALRESSSSVCISVMGADGHEVQQPADDIHSIIATANTMIRVASESANAAAAAARASVAALNTLASSAARSSSPSNVPAYPVREVADPQREPLMPAKTEYQAVASSSSPNWQDVAAQQPPVNVKLDFSSTSSLAPSS